MGHDHNRRLLSPARTVGRRIFLTDLGRGTMFVAGFGLFAACGGDDDDDGAGSGGTPAVTSSPTAAATSAPEATSPPDPTSAATPDATSAGGGADSGGASGAVDWERVNLGFVSAYLLVRGGEAVTVDTGTAGSERMIEASLEAIGLGWDAVGHVILTHAHGDHQGSLTAVMQAAPEATAYAGAADIPAIRSTRELVAVGNGDSVFGLDIIESPGHTLGHISVLDPIGGLLVAGDALNGSGGGVIGPNAQFSSNHTQALETVGILGGLEYDTVLFGHGEPVVGNASALVAELAASL